MTPTTPKSRSFKMRWQARGLYQQAARLIVQARRLNPQAEAAPFGSKAIIDARTREAASLYVRMGRPDSIPLKWSWGMPLDKLLKHAGKTEAKARYVDQLLKHYPRVHEVPGQILEERLSRVRAQQEANLAETVRKYGGTGDVENPELMKFLSMTLPRAEFEMNRNLPQPELPSSVFIYSQYFAGKRSLFRTEMFLQMCRQIYIKCNEDPDRFASCFDGIQLIWSNTANALDAYGVIAAVLFSSSQTDLITNLNALLRFQKVRSPYGRQELVAVTTILQCVKRASEGRLADYIDLETEKLLASIYNMLGLIGDPVEDEITRMFASRAGKAQKGVTLELVQPGSYATTARFISELQWPEKMNRARGESLIEHMESFAKLGGRAVDSNESRRQVILTFRMSRTDYEANTELVDLVAARTMSKNNWAGYEVRDSCGELLAGPYLVKFEG